MPPQEMVWFFVLATLASGPVALCVTAGAGIGMMLLDWIHETWIRKSS
jgi:hypothetical protein